MTFLDVDAFRKFHDPVFSVLASLSKKTRRRRRSGDVCFIGTVVTPRRVQRRPAAVCRRIQRTVSNTPTTMDNEITTIWRRKNASDSAFGSKHSDDRRRGRVVVLADSWPSSNAAFLDPGYARRYDGVSERKKRNHGNNDVWKKGMVCYILWNI